MIPKGTANTLFFATLAVVLMALSWGACDRKPDAKPVPPVPTGPLTLNESVAYLAKPELIAAPDGQGVYLICDRSVWLIHGAEAVRVSEVPAFTASPKPR